MRMNMICCRNYVEMVYFDSDISFQNDPVASLKVAFERCLLSLTLRMVSLAALPEKNLQRSAHFVRGKSRPCRRELPEINLEHLMAHDGAGKT